MALSARSTTGTTAPALRAVLFDAGGQDSEPDIAQLDPALLTDQQLLWLDACGADESTLGDVLSRLGLSEYAEAIHAGPQGLPRVENFNEWFLLHAIAISDSENHEHTDVDVDHSRSGHRHSTQKQRKQTRTRLVRITPQPFTIVTGHNFVLTLHAGPLQFLDALRQREQAETQLGVLSAESFTASLLDWHLGTYFDAVSTFEAAVDRLEVSLLASHRQRDYLPELAGLRRTVSHLRKHLSPHRNLFSALERPDFRPSDDDNASADLHFHQIGKRFDHAMAAVDNARDLVVGSFELFATRAAQRTNDNMRRLTFATVLLGTLAVLAGVLGMNFDVAFFDSGARGFWSAIAGMVLIAIASLAVARARDWL